MAQRLNIQRAPITFSSAGNNTLVAAIAAAGVNKSINIWAIALVVAGATNLQFFDGTTSLTGVMTMQASGSFFWNANDGIPAFVVSPGNAFILNQSGTAQVSGWLIYSE